MMMLVVGGDDDACVVLGCVVLICFVLYCTVLYCFKSNCRSNTDDDRGYIHCLGSCASVMNASRAAEKSAPFCGFVFLE